MKKKVKDIVHVIMCRFDRHEYVVRLRLNKRYGLKTCTHCGKSEAAGLK